MQAGIEAFEAQDKAAIETDERSIFEEKYFTITSFFETLIEARLLESCSLLIGQNH